MNTDTALRPKSLDTYVGQPALVSRLRVLIGAAKSRGEPLAHVLLHGPPGLGKTTLAYIIAAEMGSTAHVAMGTAFETPQDVYSALGRLNAGDVLFVDEIHRIEPHLAECLYPPMEDRIMHVTIGSRTVPIPLAPFTLIGATTQPGLLEPPMRDRFGNSLAMMYYSDADLCHILRANADKLGLVHEPAALTLLAARSRGTPRVANHLLRFARDYAAVNGDGIMSVEATEASLAMQGIDALGLSEQDRQYLRVLTVNFKGGPAGAEAMASTLGLKTDTLTVVVESYLLQQDLIVRTPRGRCATDKAKSHLATAA